MAEQGFTGYVSDFAGAIKENSEDIWETTQELENLFKDGLDYIIDPGTKSKILGSIEHTLESLRDQFAEGATGIGAIPEQVKEMAEMIKSGIGIDFSQALDPDQLLESISTLVPENVMPDEIKKFHQKIKEFMEKLPLDDIRVSVKEISKPVQKQSSTTTPPTTPPTPPGSSIFGDEFSNGASSNFGIFSENVLTTGTPVPTGTAPNNESILNDLFNSFSTILTDKNDLFENLIKEINKGLTSSGFLSEFKEKREAFLAKIFEGKFSLEKLLDEAGKLLASLIQIALDVFKLVFDILSGVLEDLIGLIKSLVSIGPGSLFESIFEQFGFKVQSPTVLTLPMAVISIPITLLHKALTGERLKFDAGFTQSMTQAENNNLIYGLFQIIKGIIAVEGQVIDTLIGKDQNLTQEEKDKQSFWYGTAFNSLTVIADVGGQIASIPSDLPQNSQERFQENFFGVTIWNYQWAANVAIPATQIITNVGLQIGLNVRKKQYETTTNAQKKAELKKTINRIEKGIYGFEIGSIAINTVREIVHLGLFIALLAKEKNSEKAINEGKFNDLEPGEMASPSDPRIQGTYILDSLPGIVNGLISASKLFIDRRIEKDQVTALYWVKSTFINVKSRQGKFEASWEGLTESNNLASIAGLKEALTAFKSELVNIKDNLPAGTNLQEIKVRETAIVNLESLIEESTELIDSSSLIAVQEEWQALYKKLQVLDYLAPAATASNVTSVSTIESISTVNLRRAKDTLSGLKKELKQHKENLHSTDIDLYDVDDIIDKSKEIQSQLSKKVVFKAQSTQIDILQSNISSELEKRMDLFIRLYIELNTRITRIEEIEPNLEILIEDHRNIEKLKKRSTYLSWADTGFTLATQLTYGALFIDTARVPRTEVESISTAPDRQEFSVDENVRLTITFTKPLKTSPMPTISFFPPGEETPPPNHKDQPLTAIANSNNKVFSYDYVIMGGVPAAYQDGIGYTFITIKGKDESGADIFSGIQTIKIRN